MKKTTSFILSGIFVLAFSGIANAAPMHHNMHHNAPHHVNVVHTMPQHHHTRYVPHYNHHYHHDVRTGDVIVATAILLSAFM